VAFYWQSDKFLASSPPMNEQDERFAPLGRHLLRIDGDSVYMIGRGLVTRDDMRMLLEHFARIKQEYGRLFILYDARQCPGVDAEARKLAADQPTSKDEADLQVCFGMSFAIRVVLNMIVRAQKILRNRTVRFFMLENEKEALQFFESEREKIRQEKRIKKSL
jgi:hypothetical protein